MEIIVDVMTLDICIVVNDYLLSLLQNNPSSGHKVERED